LEPGLKRPCCQNYYCDECFYKVPLCRSCGVKVGHGHRSFFQYFGELSWERIASVVLGWALTLFFTGLVLAGVGVIVASELRTPVGIFGNHCYGFFKTCQLYVCVDMSPAVASGASPVPPLSRWRPCDVSSLVKLQAQACVFDPKIFQLSAAAIGYDVCSKGFSQGVFVFEDTFEHWGNASLASNRMASALWATVSEAIPSANCGSGNVRGGEKALVFAAATPRFAETRDLDVSSGGWVEAELFLPPLGFDVAHEHCKTGYIGTVNLDFSANGGRNWTRLNSYEPAVYRSEKFFKVQEELPPAACTNATRFRFIQPIYESARDNWALDNVKVHRYLPPDWSSSAAFAAGSVPASAKDTQDAQCCGDTDWCNRRLTRAETAACRDQFPEWYSGSRYLLRLCELFVCVTALVSLIKAAYVAVQEWLMRSRLPFQDELAQLHSLVFQSALFTRLNHSVLPAKYRARSVHHVDDYSMSVHRAARMRDEFRSQLDDGEGQGERKRRQEEVDREDKREKRRLRKERKKLLERMKSKNYQGERVELSQPEEQKQAESELEQEVEVTARSRFEALQDLEQLAHQVDLTSELDLIRRQTQALLRVPFDVLADRSLRVWFLAWSVGVLGLLLVWEWSLVKDHPIQQRLRPLGLYNDSVQLSAALIVLLAAACDAREVYIALRNVVPAMEAWLPLVTVDLSDQVRCLFVGSHIVPLEDIEEHHPFTRAFAQACLAGHMAGVFPWCLFSLLLREAYLDFASMRVVIPVLGTVMVVRAVLGPGFLVKTAFALQYLFDIRFETREVIGQSFQSERTKLSAYSTSLAVTAVACVLCAVAAVQWLGPVVGAACVGGLLYGAVTGCVHGLPLKPWMYLTTLRSGVWLRVRKRQRCPFHYWGRFCTNIHNYDEVFVLFTTDEVKFLTLLKGGYGQGEGLLTAG